jgi:hypothetical protein
MNNLNNHLLTGFKKYVLFPVSTFMGAIFSALVILCSTTAAIILLSSGLLVNLLIGNGKRNFDTLSHK